ncbi:hypothetical protein GCM10010277_80120 [Streptomyces longisporoflavus]|uniref:hypothetical protein n=1 Tax=Streptomyces longisporoflavus TaxID=28044 RepID=UPI00167D3F63|nr:hypothetical protein [Streptomyces longisporoflavus]GGV69784.1 hypothetical protein GCM10010277_80120 [Streptomyces longisporoflavus]
MPITPDPATPAGKAIIDLADLMDDLRERTGQWPAADTVNILQNWLNRFRFTTTDAPTTQAADRAGILHPRDRHSDEATLRSDKASAPARLAQQVRRSPDATAGTNDAPYPPPTDNQTAVNPSYGPKSNRREADHPLHPADNTPHAHPPLPLSLADPEACAQANSSAVFHPQANPDDEGLPCIEIAGTLVFAYLDADLKALRISVHLDTTNEQLVRADGTIPLQVEIEDTTILDTLAPPADRRDRPDGKPIRGA